MIEVGASAGLTLLIDRYNDDDDARWLECLIWPGEDGRLEWLRGALPAVRRHPVTVWRGDLLDDLAVERGARGPRLAADGHRARRLRVLVENGRSVVAETDPHGTWLRWR